MPPSPAALLGWLCHPELMERWIPGVEHVEVVEGNPRAQGCLTTVTLGLHSQYGGGEWRLAGRIDEIGPARLVRTHSLRSMKAGVLPVAVDVYEYLRSMNNHARATQRAAFGRFFRELLPAAGQVLQRP